MPIRRYICPENYNLSAMEYAGRRGEDGGCGSAENCAHNVLLKAIKGFYAEIVRINKIFINNHYCPLKMDGVKN